MDWVSGWDHLLYLTSGRSETAGRVVVEHRGGPLETDPQAHQDALYQVFDLRIPSFSVFGTML